MHIQQFDALSIVRLVKAYEYWVVGDAYSVVGCTLSVLRSVKLYKLMNNECVLSLLLRRIMYIHYVALISLKISHKDHFALTGCWYWLVLMLKNMFYDVNFCLKIVLVNVFFLTFSILDWALRSSFWLNAK